MEYKVDFKAIAERTRVETVASHLGLQVKKGRIACLSCNRGGERAIELYDDTNTFYCYMAKIGGDSVALLAHQKDQRMLTSAKELDALRAPPVKAAPKKAGFDHTKYKDSLNPVVHGIPRELCERAGLGTANKGTHQGLLAIPIYEWDPTREPICFIGVPPNTVQLPKTHREEVAEAMPMPKLRLV